jgi:uncharacterized protein (DUF58 family)
MTMPQTKAAKYLDPQTLAAIGSLELRARLLVEGMMTGMHRSPYQGYSVEFAQHRQYAPGDDIRHLDWKVFGRTDKLYLKQYQKETNLDLVLLVDCSGSMAYSSQGRRGSAQWRKYDHAACIAAAMAYMALNQQDRVGLVLFSDRILSATRLSNSREHWHTVIEALLGGAPEPVGDAVPGQEDRATDLARLFEQTLAKTRQRSILVLISDLLDEPQALERGLARVQHRGHDLMVLQTLDPAERTFPFRAPADFIGLEGEGRLGLDPAALRTAYLHALNEHQQKVQQIVRQFRFDHRLLDTSEPPGPALHAFLAHRATVVDQRR